MRVLGRFGEQGAGLRFAFYADGKLVGAGSGLDLASGILVKPFLGEYTVACSDADFAMAKEVPTRLLATVVEVRDGRLLVNGEPFLVKGVNVHSLDGGNRERSRKMIRILKRLGFNTLRGDHPLPDTAEMGTDDWQEALGVVTHFLIDAHANLVRLTSLIGSNQFAHVETNGVQPPRWEPSRVPSNQTSANVATA